MKVILLPRAGGKTHQIIDVARKSQATIVCFNAMEAARVARLLKDKNIQDLPRPITFSEFIDTRYQLGVREKRYYVIDNLDLCLEVF